jgi:proteasome lid subunit RPN8/RPN11
MKAMTMQVSLPSEIAVRLLRELEQAGHREIGGILMAEQLSEPGHFRVVDFSVDPHSGKSDYFERDPSTHGAVLEAFFQRNGHDFSRFNYLGEWHSHPCFPVRPSFRDMKTMLQLVNGGDGIDFALLMIVKLIGPAALEASMTLFMRGARPTLVDFTGATTLDECTKGDGR